MCVECERCHRPYYCQARITDILRNHRIPAQTVLNVGPISKGVMAKECEYNFLRVISCAGCQPFKHANTDFIETPLNGTGDSQ